jgi:hypothetical protein
LHDKAGKVLDHGKYVVVWRREGGKWRLLRDMFSTNCDGPQATRSVALRGGV